MASTRIRAVAPPTLSDVEIDGTNPSIDGTRLDFRMCCCLGRAPLCTRPKDGRRAPFGRRGGPKSGVPLPLRGAAPVCLRCPDRVAPPAWRFGGVASSQDRLTATLCSGDVPYRRWFLAALASPFSVCWHSRHRNRAWVLRFSGLECPHSGKKSDECLAGVSMYFAAWCSHTARSSARCSPGACRTVAGRGHELAARTGAALRCGLRAPSFRRRGPQPKSLPLRAIPPPPVASVLSTLRGSHASPSSRLALQFRVLTAARSGAWTPPAAPIRRATSSGSEAPKSVGSNDETVFRLKGERAFEVDVWTFNRRCRLL